MKNNHILFKYILSAVILVVAVMTVNTAEVMAKDGQSVYSEWKSVGKKASDRALAVIKAKGVSVKKENLIVLTNAGYSEAAGVSSQSAIDGITSVTGVSRGRSTLIEVQSAPWNHLWVAVFDKGSGYCAYLQVNPLKVKGRDVNFEIATVERIDADYLYAHASDYNEKFKNIDNPEDFVTAAVTFDLPKGVEPVEWARPGVDPFKKILTALK